MRIVTRPRSKLKSDPSQPAAASGSADDLARLGEAQYRRGNADAAADLLEKSLALDRRNARANWVLGNIAQDRGNLDRAITSYRRALRANASLAEAHNDLGTAYFAKGWHQEAEECYRRAIEINAHEVGANENLAAVLRAQGRYSEARDAFIHTLGLRLRKVFGRMFRRAPARPSPGVDAQRAARDLALKDIRQLVSLRQFAQAEQRARDVLAPKSADPEMLHLLGGALIGLGRHDEALETLRKAISLRSSDPEFFVTLGNCHLQRREYIAAIERYQTALLLDPSYWQATANIASALHDLGHFREAEEIYRVSLQHEPDAADANSNLAATLNSLGKYVEAEVLARKALTLNPRSIHAILMLATALIETGRPSEARAQLAKGEAIDPDNPMLLRWIGQLELLLSGDYERAEAVFRRAQTLAPEDNSIHINLARTLLARGRFAEGWEEYEWRKRDPARAYAYTRFPYPEWDGRSLEGKAIAVSGEQGLGDEIMFASCLGEVASRAQRCVLFCNRRLEVLFQRSFPDVEVIAGSHALEKDPFPAPGGIDFQIAAGSLPKLLRRGIPDFPSEARYLKPDEHDVANFRARLRSLGPGTKVGLSWKGGTPLSDATRRTLNLQQLDPILRLPGIQWVSLQYGDCAAERESCATRSGIVLHHWQEALDDLDATASLIEALDLVVSVCNTQVHLAGGLGKEVWVLAPLCPDWRYGHAGPNMIWYPSARMFRQSVSGEWDPVIRVLKDALSGRFSAS